MSTNIIARSENAFRRAQWFQGHKYGSPSYSLELGTILNRLPLCFYDRGPLCAIRRAYALGYANPLWRRTEAVRIMFLSHMQQAEARGRGNKARRRAGASVAWDNLQMAKP